MNKGRKLSCINNKLEQEKCKVQSESRVVVHKVGETKSK